VTKRRLIGRLERNSAVVPVFALELFQHRAIGEPHQHVLELVVVGSPMAARSASPRQRKPLRGRGRVGDHARSAVALAAHKAIVLVRPAGSGLGDVGPGPFVRIATAKRRWTAKVRAWND